MAAHVSEDAWAPMPGALPTRLDPDTIYIIPTRKAVQAGDGGLDLCFTDTVRYLPKAARAQGLPVEFSQVDGERRYLQEFSISPETWSLGLALMNMTSDWLILTVSLFIAHRAEHQGWSSDEAQELPLKVSVAETVTGRNYQIEGSGADVIEALRVLQLRDGPERQ
jgi:hypothetical protein